MVGDCLQSVADQDLSSVETIVIDNASTDDSASEISARFPGFRMLRLDSNKGYTGGMNAGIRAARGRFVALLNFDVALEKDYLRLCADALAADPGLGGVTGKLLRPGPADPPVIDTTGHIVYRNRRAVDRGESEPDRGQYDEATDVFGVCGAAPVYRKEMLDDVAVRGEFFDDDFFAYFEDFDLAWRARLRGWRFACVPEATGRHHRGGSGGKASTFILACNHRNRLLVMLRNDLPGSFFRHLPGIAYTELRATLHMLTLRPAALVRAWVDFFRLAHSQTAKRRIIQSKRTAGREELEQWFEPYHYGIRATMQRARRRAALR